MTIIAEGSHTARAISGLAFIKSPEKGTAGVFARFEIKDGTFAGQSIDWQAWLADGSLPFTAQALDAMGYDGTNPDSITKADVSLKIKHRTFEGKDGKPVTVAEVAFVNPLGAARYQPLSAVEESAAKERLRSALTALRASSKATSEDEPRF